MITNPVAQVAQMYNLLESHLRWAAKKNSPLSVPDLNKQGDIAAIAKSTFQARDLVKGLVKKGFVIRDENGYMWDLGAPPFVISARSLKHAKEDPSLPIVKTRDNRRSERRHLPAKTPIDVAPRRFEVTKEVELVLEGALMIIGRNDKTGRLRIIIEDVGA